MEIAELGGPGAPFAAGRRRDRPLARAPAWRRSDRVGAPPRARRRSSGSTRARDPRRRRWCHSRRSAAHARRAASPDRRRRGRTSCRRRSRRRPSRGAARDSSSVASTTPAGTISQIARGGCSAATNSASETPGTAPSLASARVPPPRRRATTQVCPPRSRRLTMLAPMRPSPIIPICITTSPMRMRDRYSRPGSAIRYVPVHDAGLHRPRRSAEGRAPAGGARAPGHRRLGRPGGGSGHDRRSEDVRRRQHARAGAADRAARRHGRRRGAGGPRDRLALAALAGRRRPGGAPRSRRAAGGAARARRRAPRAVHAPRLVRPAGAGAGAGRLRAGDRAAPRGCTSAPTPARATTPPASTGRAALRRRRRRRRLLRRLHDLLHAAEPRQVPDLQLGPRPARQPILQRAPRPPVPLHAAHPRGELERAPQSRRVLGLRALAVLRAPPGGQHAAGPAVAAARQRRHPALPVRRPQAVTRAGGAGGADLPRLPADARRADVRLSLPAGRRRLPDVGDRRLRPAADGPLRPLLGGGARLPRGRRHRNLRPRALFW